MIQALKFFNNGHDNILIISFPLTKKRKSFQSLETKLGPVIKKAFFLWKILEFGKDKKKSDSFLERKGLAKNNSDISEQYCSIWN